ncbi:MAG: YtxH domain-containing protein [Clostridiaceae bacterium]|nr:YtxH domain-containing protein [Clostridiaceae bacterium]
MGNRFFKGIAAGTIIGAAAGMILYPKMDRSTRNKLKKSGRMMMTVAESAFGEMRHWRK